LGLSPAKVENSKINKEATKSKTTGKNPKTSRFMLFPQHKTLAPCSDAKNAPALVK